MERIKRNTNNQGEINMSFPGKENLIFFESLAANQQKLYDDAADVGVKLQATGRTYYFGDVPMKIAARENLLALMDIYAYKMQRDLLNSVTEIFIPFEFDEGAYTGVTLMVAFNKNEREVGEQHLHVHIKSDRKTHAEANANGPLYKAMPERRAMPQPEQDADEEAAYLAEQGRSNPNAWAEAAYEAKRFNR
jgi:hypothetical protein